LLKLEGGAGEIIGRISLAQEFPARVGAKQIQLFGGVPRLSQSHRPNQRRCQTDGLLLRTGDIADEKTMSSRSVSRSEPSVRLIEREQPVFPVNVAVGDKNPMVLSALEGLLTRDRRFNLLLMTSDGEEFVNCLDRLSVDLGITGWELPPLRAPDILQMVAKRPGAPKIVVYSGTRDPTAPAVTLHLGGAGFVNKLSAPERLLEVFAAVAAGDMVFPFDNIHRARPNPLESLTNRERDLLAALETGRSNAQLAREFGVSVNTVKFHLRNLFGKLAVRNRTQAICLYLEARR